MSDVVAVYDKYDEMVCDTYLNFVEHLEDAHALLVPDDDADFDKVLKFRTARINAFRYWNGDSANPTSGLGGTGISGDGGSGNAQEDKAKKMEKSMERLQQARKALQELTSSSSSVAV